VASSWFDKLGEQFAPVLSKLTNTALGMGMGLVQQSVLDATPGPYRDTVRDILEEVTRSLGTKPLPPPTATDKPESPRAHAHNGYSSEETLGTVG